MSKKKSPNYLIDTSLVRAAIGDLGKTYETFFRRETADGKLWASTYIRMECIRRWILTAIRLAIWVDLHRDLDDALVRAEQSFSIREVKAFLSHVRALLQSRACSTPREAAEELARHAVHWLRRFDRIFSSRIQNTCRCQIGGRELWVDFDHLLDDLREFYVTLSEPIKDCEVNTFLKFEKPNGRTGRLLAYEGVGSLPVGKWLRKYCSERQTIDCVKCARIGDAIIALEQPPSYMLVSTDGSFATLCAATNRPFKQLQSPVSVLKDTDQPP